MKDRTTINARVSEYEAALREAEAAIENAGKAICSLRGNFPHRELNQAYENIQNAIRDCWRLYDNPDITIAR